MKLSESVILECKCMPILCIKSTKQSYLCICLLRSQHAYWLELTYSLFDFSGIIFKWKAKNENIKSGTVKKRAMVKKGSAHNWSQIFSSSKQIYLSNFSVSNFIVVQRDDSQFANSYEYTEKKIWRQKRNIINIYKLFVLPGGNGWLIWSTPFYRKYI